MWKKLKSLGKQKVVKTLTNEKMEEIKRNNFFQFTNEEMLLVKDSRVVGKLHTAERIKPKSLDRGALVYVYLYTVEAAGKSAEFIDKDIAIEWLLLHTSEEWLD